jgi:hypothetical protein
MTNYSWIKIFFKFLLLHSLFVIENYAINRNYHITTQLSIYFYFSNVSSKVWILTAKLQFMQKKYLHLKKDKQNMRGSEIQITHVTV